MIDSATVRKYFPARIAVYLHKGGFEELFDVFTNGSQKVVDVYPTSGDMNDVEAQAFCQAEHVLYTAMMDFLCCARHKYRRRPNLENSCLGCRVQSIGCVPIFPNGLQYCRCFLTRSNVCQERESNDTAQQRGHQCQYR